MKKATLALIAFATAIMGSAQQSNPNQFSGKDLETENISVPVEESYARKTERIQEISRTLGTLPNQEEALKEIERLQGELLELREQAKKEREDRLEAIPASTHTLYAFNHETNTLKLKDFDYSFEPVTGQLNVKFNSKETGDGSVVLVTPGKLHIDDESLSAFEGSFAGKFDISNQSIKEYYLHIKLNGKMTTKRIMLK